MRPETTSIVYECNHCRTPNRIPEDRLNQNPICGKCKNKLFPHEPVLATDQSFNQEVNSSPLPVLVDFWAPWCGPCHSLAPVLERIAEERASKLKIVKVNVDESPMVADKFKIRSIPTLVLLHHATQITEMVGALPKHELDARLDQYLRPN